MVKPTQIPNNNNNETSEIDHQIDRLLAPIRQSKRLFGEKQIELIFYCLDFKCIHNKFLLFIVIVLFKA